MSATSRNICWLALYNAPATIDSYYASLVNHDLYGSGERR